MTKETDRIFYDLALKHRTPKDVQRFIRTFPYNKEKDGESCRSALGALRARTAHCLEASFLAAAILERYGYPPLVMSLESMDNLDHVVYVFKDEGRWGSIGQSRCVGLHGREPVFKTIQQLAASYIDPFVDKTGRCTAFGVAHLDDIGVPWRGAKNNVWKAERYLIELPHQPLRSGGARYKEALARFNRVGEPKRGPHWW